MISELVEGDAFAQRTDVYEGVMLGEPTTYCTHHHHTGTRFESSQSPLALGFSQPPLQL
eukprot:COSAG05_NODE_2919_length_2511_cov_1.360282_2_plen_59_part_00